MTRSARYQRAVTYGLDPPDYVPLLIERFLTLQDPSIDDKYARLYHFIFFRYLIILCFQFLQHLDQIRNVNRRLFKFYSTVFFIIF